MPREFSLANLVVWLGISTTTLIVSMPTAIFTVATMTDWTTALIDLEGGEVVLPTWFTFGMNCALVPTAALVALGAAGLLIRRRRGLLARRPSPRARYEESR